MRVYGRFFWYGRVRKLKNCSGCVGSTTKQIECRRNPGSLPVVPGTCTLLSMLFILSHKLLAERIIYISNFSSCRKSKWLHYQTHWLLAQVTLNCKLGRSSTQNILTFEIISAERISLLTFWFFIGHIYRMLLGHRKIYCKRLSKKVSWFYPKCQSRIHVDDKRQSGN